MFKIEPTKIVNYVNNDFNDYDESYNNSKFSDQKFINYEYKIDFNNCYFDNIDFKNNNIEGFVFDNCYFKNCDFSNTNFYECGMLRCTFVDCKFMGTKVLDSNLKNINFLGCSMLYLILSNSN